MIPPLTKQKSSTFVGKAPYEVGKPTSSFEAARMSDFVTPDFQQNN